MQRETKPTSRRQTPRLVRWSDRIAESVITFGGLGVVAAMLGICVFLVAVAVPLFRAGSASEPSRVSLTTITAPPIFAAFSSDHRWYAIIDKTGRASISQIETGEIFAQAELFAPTTPISAASFETASGWVFLGHEDGSVSTGQLGLNSGILPESRIPESLLKLTHGDSVGLNTEQLDAINASKALRFTASAATVFSRLEDGGIITCVEAEISDPVMIKLGEGPVTRISGTASNEREKYVVASRQSGEITLGQIRVRRSLSGGATKTRLSQIPVTTAVADTPDWLMVDADGLHTLAIFADGRLDLHTRESSRAREFALTESIQAVEPGNTITTATAALGARSLLLGDSLGRVSSWAILPSSLLESNDGEPVSGISMTSRSTPGLAITQLATSTIDRTVLVTDQGGSVWLLNMTSLRRVVKLPGVVADPIALTLGGDLDAAGLLSADGTLTFWTVDPAYPEVGWRSLMMPIQYEGYTSPSWVYQSTGSPVVEPKMSLVPLIWGTIKATIISMLIAAPLAVLAAIYTSEFLHPRIRRVVKPVIELMASLPSVVLGFIAAMVIAPYMRDYLSQVLLALFLVPVSLIIGSSLVRFVPARAMHRVTSGVQLSLIAGTIAVAALLAAALGSSVENLLFDNPDLDSNPGSPSGMIPWLNGNYGSPTPGWMLATIPVSLLVLMIMWSRVAGRRWGEWISGRTRVMAATAELTRVLVLLASSVLLGLALAWLLSTSGLDPRDSVFGSYSQRNTLVVGLVMGFAVIPIIYTISEDALQAVPSGLRSASLGTGATRWQTAIRVVLPVAGSGIFSACMVGLGRAVGETMIVLMATGNTPELTANIFSGFRTLAANIAVELPEAPQGGSHYRVLFLCGLVLFVITLLINTTAEIVRQRVRRKNAGL